MHNSSSSPAPVNGAASTAEPAAVTFASLARRRPDLFSAHFSLSWGRACATRAGAESGAHASSPDDRKAGVGKPQVRETLALAVGKRHLARAVDRNAMKRVAREAWRARLRVSCDARALLRVRSADREWAAMSLAMRKRAWRAEIDALLARMKRPAR